MPNVEGENLKMDFSTLGPWLAFAAAASAVVRAFIVWMALRGTKPEDRPEILRALPSLLPNVHRDSSPPENVPSGGGPAP